MMENKGESKFLEAVSDWFVDYSGYEDAVVTNVEQVKEVDGYCETCYCESIEVEISYYLASDESKEIRVYTYFDDMADLINRLICFEKDKS